MDKISLHANYIINYIFLMETDHTMTQVLGYWVISTSSQIQSQDRLAKLAQLHVFIQVLWFSHQCSYMSTINATVYNTDSSAKSQNQSTNLGTVVKHKHFYQFYPLTILKNTVDS